MSRPLFVANGTLTFHAALNWHHRPVSDPVALDPNGFLDDPIGAARDDGCDDDGCITPPRLEA
jgi:hypothetical protein